MLIPRTPLQAYLLDTAEPATDPTTNTWLAGCLAYGSALDRAATNARFETCELSGNEWGTEVENGQVFLDERGLEREYLRLRSLAEEYRLTGAPPSPKTDALDACADIFSLTRAVANQGERRGALQLPYTLLAMLERLPYATVPLEYGRVLALRARIARKADALDVAEELYRRVQRIAKNLSSDELTSRALVGRGVLAHSKGNYPEARRFYTQAARSAKKSRDPSLIRHAYHGLMVVAAQYGDRGQALKVGWIAFREASGDREAEADMLLNLAQLAFDSGEPKAALHGFAAALARDPAPWRCLPALGGAARAAAAIGNQALLETCAERVDSFDGTSANFAYPRAAALWDMARAFHQSGLQAKSITYAERAHALSSAHHFFELALQTEHLILSLRQREAVSSPEEEAPTPEPARPTIDADGHAVLRRLTALEHPERVLAHL